MTNTSTPPLPRPAHPGRASMPRPTPPRRHARLLAQSPPRRRSRRPRTAPATLRRLVLAPRRAHSVVPPDPDPTPPRRCAPRPAPCLRPHLRASPCHWPARQARPLCAAPLRSFPRRPAAPAEPILSPSSPDASVVYTPCNLLNASQVY
nr:vegetative cell wall protein gp1-like [Lolium perenne]